jgi:cytochrome P450
MTKATQDVQPQWKDLAWHRGMRDTNPVWQDRDTGFWHVFRYAEAAAILGDHPTFSSDFSGVFPGQREILEGNILAMDPPPAPPAAQPGQPGVHATSHHPTGRPDR